jgi:hypothetical protein
MLKKVLKEGNYPGDIIALPMTTLSMKDGFMLRQEDHMTENLKALAKHEKKVLAKK